MSKQTKTEARTMTQYTDKELRSEAIRAIREEAKAATCRARCLGYSLIIGDGVTLVAHGQRTDDPFRPGEKGYRFDRNIAI